MKEFIEPFPRYGDRPAHGRALGGSTRVWFDTARPWGCTERPTPATLLSEVDEKRLTAPRPPLCGLSLEQPRIMGILNVTPDSFSDGGDAPTVAAAVARAQAMAVAADILDIGGESTRPGADAIPVAEEIARTVPVISAIREAGIACPISIDTRKAEVAAAALDAGADMVNDVSALTFDPDLKGLIAERGVPVCLMHAKGTPKTMQQEAVYEDVVAEVAAGLQSRITAARRAGIARENIVIDPGIGFGKTLQHNVTILRHLSLYHDLGCPILLGASRKRFIGTLGHAAEAKDRMPGSVAVALHGISHGVQIVRVHDVTETRQAMDLHLALNAAQTEAENGGD